MKKPVTHARWGIPPNESDTQGHEYIVCGRDTVKKSTRCSDLVTCRQCLKRIEKIRKGQP